jgi:hypothetical protein
MADFSDFVATRSDTEQQQATILGYCETLCQLLTKDAPDSHTFTVETARKYHKVIMTTHGTNRSIHAFVDVKDGSVYKPASFKAPAKGIRYHLLDPISREKCLTRAGWCNHYLYNRI